jgi:hypothetical protein
VDRRSFLKGALALPLAPGSARAQAAPARIWMHTYNEVTTKGGRYVQGGGCGTVGVAGLV